MRKFIVVAIAATLGVNAFGVDLYNQLAQTYSVGNGDWDGGVNTLGGNYGLQVGQRVVGIGDSARLVTGVSGIFIHSVSDPTPTGALIQIFNLSGNTVGSLVGQQSVTTGGGLSYTLLGGSQVTGYNASQLDATVAIDLGAGSNGVNFLVVIQGQGANWSYIARNTASGLQDTFGRDYSSFGYPGGYNNTNWTEMGALGQTSGTANMRVQAGPVPEPASLAVIGLGALGLLRRRRNRS